VPSTSGLRAWRRVEDGDRLELQAEVADAGEQTVKLCLVADGAVEAAAGRELLEGHALERRGEPGAQPPPDGDLDVAGRVHGPNDPVGLREGTSRSRGFTQGDQRAASS
jgi:hypothetical protein